MTKKKTLVTISSSMWRRQEEEEDVRDPEITFNRKGMQRRR